MLLDANFNERIVIDTLKNPWVPSPVSGVERNMLDGVGTPSCHVLIVF